MLNIWALQNAQIEYSNWLLQHSLRYTQCLSSSKHSTSQLKLNVRYWVSASTHPECCILQQKHNQFLSFREYTRDMIHDQRYGSAIRTNTIMWNVYHQITAQTTCSLQHRTQVFTGGNDIRFTYLLSYMDISTGENPIYWFQRRDQRREPACA